MSTQASIVVQHEDLSPAGSTPSWPARYARFGQFQVDLQREELFRDGRRAKVQAKIYQALLVLIARPGDIITRDQVCKRLWPEALHVNLDANVNTTINKLRLVLGDSPEAPAYIETIPRRGYSFIAPVQFSDEPVPIKPPASLDKTTSRTPALSSPTESSWLSPLRMPPTPLRLASFVLIGMLMGALLVFAWKFASNRNQPTEGLGRQSVSLPSHGDREL
jgi:DNA-binding winged helix-turn-helix (wHTH) protein